jgi:hypothetical protein
MDAFNPNRIPPCVRSALDNYRLHGLWPGDTTHRLLTGDVFGAFARADDETRAAMPAILEYIARNMPTEAFGTPVRVRTWMDSQAAARMRSRSA